MKRQCEIRRRISGGTPCGVGRIHQLKKWTDSINSGRAPRPLQRKKRKRNLARAQFQHRGRKPQFQPQFQHRGRKPQFQPQFQHRGRKPQFQPQFQHRAQFQHRGRKPQFQPQFHETCLWHRPPGGTFRGFVPRKESPEKRPPPPPPPEVVEIREKGSNFSFQPQEPVGAPHFFFCRKPGKVYQVWMWKNVCAGSQKVSNVHLQREKSRAS